MMMTTVLMTILIPTLWSDCKLEEVPVFIVIQTVIVTFFQTASWKGLRGSSGSVPPCAGPGGLAPPHKVTIVIMIVFSIDVFKLGLASHNDPSAGTSFSPICFLWFQGSPLARLPSSFFLDPKSEHSIEIRVGSRTGCRTSEASPAEFPNLCEDTSELAPNAFLKFRRGKIELCLDV